MLEDFAALDETGFANAYFIEYGGKKMNSQINIRAAKIEDAERLLETDGLFWQV